MSGGNVKKIAGTLSLLLFLYSGGYSQDSIQHPVRLMFYNVENLFDIYNDTTTDDDEFLPEGVRRWNSARYRNKISLLFKTITAAGGWNPPDLIGLCEVENRRVVEDLVYGTNLSKFNYGIIHQDSPDPRGIDVCLLYRKDRIGIIDSRFLKPADIRSEEYSTRTVLYAKCKIGKDTVHLFVNHWPSRRGGVLSGEELRSKIADMIMKEADSIAGESNGKIRLIVTGDFNSAPDDPSLVKLTGRYISGLAMINLSESLSPGAGSYRYMGTWEMIDQVLVSDYLINCRTGFFTGRDKLKIFKPEFLLKQDSRYPGLSPFSTYSGYRYQGGYSDHLPLLLDLDIRQTD